MTPTAEFSHIVTVEPWPLEAITIELVATVEECERLKKRFDLVDCKALKAIGKIEKADHELVFDGTFEADVVQTCVATLKPIASTVKASFERRYRQGGDDMDGRSQGDDALDNDEVDVEILREGHIDAGEVVAEEFYLALDPYPRADDADLVMAEVQGVLGRDDDEQPDNPFAKLRRH